MLTSTSTILLYFFFTHLIFNLNAKRDNYLNFQRKIRIKETNACVRVHPIKLAAKPNYPFQPTYDCANKIPDSVKRLAGAYSQKLSLPRPSSYYEKIPRARERRDKTHFGALIIIPKLAALRAAKNYARPRHYCAPG